MNGPRLLSDVIDDIEHSWENIPVPARFYLEDLAIAAFIVGEPYKSETIGFLIDSFLWSAGDWKGSTADTLKNELTEISRSFQENRFL